MDVRQLEALHVVCALLCTEKKQEKKNRIWVKEWVAACGLRRLSILQRELEEMLRMTAEDFDFLLGLVEPYIASPYPASHRLMLFVSRVRLLQFSSMPDIQSQSQTRVRLCFCHVVGLFTQGLVVADYWAILYRFYH